MAQRASAELRVLADGGRATGTAALRELLALQASDWAFGVTRETAGPYPLERADGHAAELEPRSRSGRKGARLRNLHHRSTWHNPRLQG